MAALRRQRRTGGEIAAALGLSRATVFRVLARLGLSRLKSLDPAEPVRRYERATPGKMLHIDIKKLGRFNRTGHRITVQRVMTDNASCYRSKAFRKACADRGIKHIRTRPYTPKTNGKAERFIQTALHGWAYAQAYETSNQRTDELLRRLHRYNWHRPHGSLKAQTPISRLRLPGDNVMRLHS